MEEALRNRIVVILAILTGLFFLGTIKSCATSSRLKAARDKEMAQRLDLEEKTSKIFQDKAALEEKIKAQDKELQEEKASHQATTKALVQEQLVNQSLKEELTKVTKLKETLEADLKEALVSSKPKVKK